MKFLKFIRWWWDTQLNSGEKGYMTVFGSLIFFFGSGFIFGLKGFAIATLVFLSIFAFYLLVIFFRYIKRKWEKYNEEVRKEQDRMVNILKGRDY